MRWRFFLFTLVVMVLAASAHAVSIGKPLNYVPGEVIVKFRPDCGIEEQAGGAILNRHVLPAEIHEGLGSKIMRDFTPRGIPGLQLAQISDGMTVDEAIAKYQENPCVLYAEPNYIGEYTETIPSDTDFASQWALRNTGQSSGTVDADIDASDAWDLMTGSPSVLIALPDSGTEITHPDLAGNIWTNPGEIPGNGIDDEGNGFIDDVHGWDFEVGDNDVSSTNTHGTHCAGIIGAEGNNGQGVSGAMWDTRILPLKIGTGAPTTANAVDAILYANARGADVISCSWNVGDAQSLRDAITASSALVVVAAGNSGVDIDIAANNVYPASYTMNNILVVTGTDRNDNQQYNFGATSVDVGAPGVDIRSTVLGGSYGSLSGTSMATPLTASCAGMLKARDPSLSNTDLKAILMNTGDSLTSLSGITVSGRRINLYNALIITDDIKPVTTLTLTGTMGCSGWYAGPVTISLSATDDFSLVDTTEYAINGGSWTAYTAPFTVSDQGTTTISYRSTDHAGNVEGAKPGSFKIDSVPPVITGAPTTTPNADGWYNHDVIVHFGATDSGSGLKSVSPDATLSSEGMGQSVAGTAEDNACNTASLTVTGIHIDKTPPVVSITSPENGREYAINEPVIADWAVTDALSLVKSASGTFPDGAVVPTNIGGSYTFTVTGTDFADNTASLSVTYSVHYIFGGVLPPLTRDTKAFKQGSTIPVKFQIFDYSGTPIGTAVAHPYVKAAGPEIPAPSRNGFPAFRYDEKDQQYIFNLDTKPLSPGGWTMRIKLDDGTSHSVPFTLR